MYYVQKTTKIWIKNYGQVYSKRIYIPYHLENWIISPNFEVGGWVGLGAKINLQLWFLCTWISGKSGGGEEVDIHMHLVIIHLFCVFVELFVPMLIVLKYLVPLVHVELVLAMKIVLLILIVLFQINVVLMVNFIFSNLYTQGEKQRISNDKPLCFYLMIHRKTNTLPKRFVL